MFFTSALYRKPMQSPFDALRVKILASKRRADPDVETEVVISVVAVASVVDTVFDRRAGSPCAPVAPVAPVEPVDPVEPVAPVGPTRVVGEPQDPADFGP